MERPTDELVKRLLAVADARADEGMEKLIAEVTAEAESEVRDLLRSAMTAALLRRAVATLESASLERAPRRGRDRHRPEPNPTDRRGTSTLEASAERGETAAYVYCITRPTVLESWTKNDILSVDPAHPPMPVTSGGIAAVISSVSSEMFDQAAMAERIKDLDWVGQKVRAHDQVVKQVMELGPVIPLRFGMVLRSHGDVLDFLNRHQQDLARELDRLEGKKEWGVKVYMRPEVFSGRAHGNLREPDNEEARAGGDTGRGAGAAYLMQRTRHDRDEAEARQMIRAYAQECHERLAAVSDGAVQLSVARAGASMEGADDGANTLISNGAYLVADDHAATFGDAVEALSDRFAAEGLELEVTGPWPPYNFVRLDLSRDLSSVGGPSGGQL